MSDLMNDYEDKLNLFGYFQTSPFNRLHVFLNQGSDFPFQLVFFIPTKSHMSQVLTNLSLASLFWDIGKQNSPRCDAAERRVPSGAILFA